jgi:hypothetical protein
MSFGPISSHATGFSAPTFRASKSNASVTTVSTGSTSFPPARARRSFAISMRSSSTSEPPIYLPCAL